MNKWREHLKLSAYALLIGAIYYGLVELALKFRVSAGPKSISFFWPPIGLVLAVLTRCPWRFWAYVFPPLIVASILANLEADRTIIPVLLFTFDDILVPAAGAVALRRFLNDQRAFSGSMQTVAFLFVTAIVCVVSASVGVGVQAFQDSHLSFIHEWRIWATSTLIGMVMIAPPILSFSRDIYVLFDKRKLAEGIFVQILLIIPTYFAFHQQSTTGMPVRLLVYASIPLLLWSALRAGVFGTSISLFVIGAVSVWQISTGPALKGSTEAQIADELGWVQAFYAAVSFSSLMVASLFSEFQQSLADRKLQSSILSMIAAARPLDITLRELVLGIQSRVPEMIGSVLLFDPATKTLTTVAGPNLPREYNELISNFPIGPKNGSCGTAAFRKERVIVEDILTSELWAPYLDLARKFNLHSCWSQPIMNSAGQVHGTFALYYHQPRKPTQGELDLIRIAADLAEVAIERDHIISEIRERERSYAALISNLSGMVYRVKLDGNRTPLYFSDGTLALTGYSAADMMSGVTNVRSLIHPDDLPRVLETSRQQIVSHEPISIECRIRTRNGREKWVWTQATVRYAEDGTPLETEGFCTEITARKRAEFALQAARQTAEEASKAKDQFLAMLSHELRTPLTPVMLYVSMMEKQSDLPAETRAEMGIIKAQLQQETRLIDDLLDVTRIDRGKFRIDKKAINFRNTIDQVLSIQTAAIEEKDLTLNVSVDATSHDIFGDPGRMQQLVMNLLSNAVKFTRPGGTINVKTFDSGESRLTFEVTDTGIGISEEEIRKLFRPFEQGVRARSPEYGGLGLGLTIVKAIAELHGGSIKVESPGENKGTTVTVELPLWKDASPLAVTSTAPVPRSSGRLRIMVVEDHDASRGAILALLRALHHDAFGVGTITDAMKHLDAPIDLLLSDIQLPDGTGLSLMQKFKSHRDVPAIALSGLGTDADVERSLAAGFKAHLVKPVDIDVLEKTIADVLHS